MLKVLLHERHWQNYSTFCAEYDKAAVRVDNELTGGFPSRAQLHRWLSGALRGLPYADHCRVLEEMFTGWTAEQLFQPATNDVMFANGQPYSATAAGSPVAGPPVFAAPSIGLRPFMSRPSLANTSLSTLPGSPVRRSMAPFRSPWTRSASASSSQRP